MAATLGNSNSFRGGTSTDNKRYIVVKAGPCRNIRVHILVAEAMLGRKLKPDESVHHRDGNKRNPRWCNLLIMNSTQHNCVSSRQRWYMKQLLSKEEAAWRAYFDVTGETYAMYDARAAGEITFSETAFNPKELETA